MQPLTGQGVCATEGERTCGQVSYRGGSSGDGHSSSGSLGLHPALPWLALSGAPDTSSGLALTLALIVVGFTPPNVVVKAAVPAKAETPTEESPKEKGPNAGGSAACPAGVGCAAGAADEDSPLSAQQQLW